MGRDSRSHGFGSNCPTPTPTTTRTRPPSSPWRGRPIPSCFFTQPYKKAAVIGEQITYSIYLYFRPNADLRAPSWHDAPLADFLRLPLLKNPGAEPAARVTVGGQRWRAKLLDRVAIFGVRAGDLHTGSQRITLGRAERASEDQIIRVTEPPTTGRPPGYALGDVGRYTLTADVKSRNVNRGGSVSVVVTLSGTGNLPHSLRVPQQSGVEWLEPEQRENLEPQGGAIARSRTFGYLVRVTESGHVDSATLRFPTRNPWRRSTRLRERWWGASRSRPQRGRRPKDLRRKRLRQTKTCSPRCHRLERACRRLRPTDTKGFRAVPSGFVSQLRPFWSGPPASARDSCDGCARSARRRSVRPPRCPSRPLLMPQTVPRGEMRKRAVASAVERATHFAIEGVVGLRSRGILLSSLADELDRRGVSTAVAARVVGLLSQCDALGFVPTPSDATDRNLLDQALTVISDLEGERP